MSFCLPYEISLNCLPFRRALGALPRHFDASALAGQDVVVFEKLYYTDGKTEHEIASHEDLKDEGQTVHMTELPKEPETPPVAPPVKTGDETPLLLYAGIAIAALAGASVLGIVYFKRKKKHQ